MMTKQQTNETLRADMWRACDILHRDNNVGGVMQHSILENLHEMGNYQASEKT